MPRLLVLVLTTIFLMTGTAAADPAMADPPPLPPGTPLPSDSVAPDLDYQVKTRCVQSAPGTETLLQMPWGQTRLRVDELHRFVEHPGAGQTVVVIDTGVHPHDFLGDRLSGGGDLVVPADNGLADCDGHGTLVAGIIAASPPEGSRIGFRGIAPEARIISIRQTSKHYEGTPAPTPDDPRPQARPAGTVPTLARAIMRAANLAQHGVLTMSVNRCRSAAEGPILAEERQVQAALRFAVEDRDVVVVASAGNTGEGGCPAQNPDSDPDPSRPSRIVIPAWFDDHVLSVAAIDRDGNPASFSVAGPWVGVGAPGTEVTSLDPGNSTTLANRLYDKEGRPTQIQGTSFAAPYVAGTAALVRQRFPTLTARQVMHRIKATAVHPATATGRDDRVGSGMINPMAALTAMIPEEHGIPADRPTTITATLPPPAHRDRTPAVVALIGAAGGGVALLVTLFVVHTVRRTRRPG